MSTQNGQGRNPSSSYMRWTNEMTRCLLDYIDEVAGDKSPFMTNKPRALENARMKLQPVTGADARGFLDGVKIDNKIHKLAGRCGGSKHTDLFKKGTAVLDLSKVPAGVYLPAEIQAAALRKSRPKKSSPRTQSSDIRNQRRDKRKSDGSGLKKRKYDHGNNGLAEDRKNKTRHAPATSIDGAGTSLRVSTRGADRVNYDETSDLEPIEQAQTHVPQAVDHLTSTVEDLRATRNTDGVEDSHTCELCERTFPCEDFLLEHKKIHTQSAYSRVSNGPTLFDEPSDIVESRAEPQLHDPNSSIMRLVKEVGVGEHADVQYIKSTMKVIRADIFYATKQFVADLRFDGNESVRIDLTNCEDRFQDLLRIIFGSGIDPRHPRDNIFPRGIREIRRLELLLSVIGCAVSTWALRPRPQGEKHGGMLEEVLHLLEESSKVLRDNVEEIATRRYLEKYVKADIKQVARSLADELYHLLRHIMPVMKQKNLVKSGDTVVDSTVTALALITPKADEGTKSSSQSSPSTELFSIESSTSTPATLQTSNRWPVANYHHPEYHFKQSLQQIFERALELRLDMEMKGNAKYRIIFPMSGDFKFEEMVPCNISNNSMITDFDMEGSDSAAGVAVNIKVVVPLMPLITGRFRSNRNEPYKKDEIIISKSYVHIRDVSV